MYKKIKDKVIIIDAIPNIVNIYDSLIKSIKKRQH